MSFSDENASVGGGGIAVPFGRAGCAAAMAGLLGFIGLLLPTTLLQSIAFQLYLDQIFPAAVPPFGWLSHVVSALALGAVGAALGWVLGRLFGVVPSGWTLRNLLDRVRGVGREDDADAPVLRSADRHPDAPARRPFSAATDIPHGNAPDYQAAARGPALGGMAEDEDEELLLDYSFADAPPMTPDSALSDPPLAPAAPVAPVMAQPAAPIWRTVEAAAAPAPLAQTLAEPTLTPAAPPPPPQQVAPVVPPEPAAPPAPAMQPAPEPSPVVEPADFAHDRLDALLARLEAGLARRALQGEPAATAADPVGPLPVADARPADAVHPEPPRAAAPVTVVGGTDAMSDDPALAAALATLRRMHQHVG